MSKGTNNFQQLNSNRKSAIKIGFLIDRKAYLTSSESKSYVQNTKWQATLARYNNYNMASLDAKQLRKNALKSSADYLAQEQKAWWFETRSQLPTN